MPLTEYGGEAMKLETLFRNYDLRPWDRMIASAVNVLIKEKGRECLSVPENPTDDYLSMLAMYAVVCSGEEVEAMKRMILPCEPLRLDPELKRCILDILCDPDREDF